MEIHKVMVLLAALLSSTTSFADTTATDANRRAEFASLHRSLQRQALPEM